MATPWVLHPLQNHQQGSPEGGPLVAAPPELADAASGDGVSAWFRKMVVVSTVGQARVIAIGASIKQSINKTGPLFYTWVCVYVLYLVVILQTESPPLVIIQYCMNECLQADSELPSYMLIRGLASIFHPYL